MSKTMKAMTITAKTMSASKTARFPLSLILPMLSSALPKPLFAVRIWVS